MKKRFLFIILLLQAVVFCGCESASDDKSAHANTTANTTANTAANTPAKAAAKAAVRSQNPYDFTLLAADGSMKTLAHFAGEKLVIYFGYTLCADVCPTSLAIAGDALAELGAQKVKILFITLDPARDTPENLSEYAQYFWPNSAGLAPTKAELERLCKAYGARYEYVYQDSAADYTVAHSSSFYLIDEHGKFAGEISNLARKNVLKKFKEFLEQN